MVFIIVYIFLKYNLNNKIFDDGVLGNNNNFQFVIYNKINGIKLREIIQTGKCDESKGLRMVLIKSDILDRYECISVFPMFLDNNGKLFDYVCKNGHVNYYNLKNTVPTGDFCVCDKLEYKKTFIHSVPVCVKNPNLYK